jgi:hypothetical protein
MLKNIGLALLLLVGTGGIGVLAQTAEDVELTAIKSYLLENVAELGDLRRFDNVRQVVAFVGLNPRQHQSGKKRVTHGISRTGRASLRAALYMPAVVAQNHNPALKDWAAQMQQRGLTGKQVVVAVMRKLLHLAYGVLKSGQAFQTDFAPAPAFAA